MDDFSPSTGFVAINSIDCSDAYRERFEALFKSRARAIDRLPGFRSMDALRPSEGDGPYLVVSRWDSEASFRKWTGSPEFHEGHRLAFEDLKAAKAQGVAAPMSSQMTTYEVLTK